ncbi:MAG: TonB-dependent receptor [Gammaproteobacteria bacterium]|nr:TonB-dependent receptor [Gammaproteobacteria bacterium]
MNAPYFLGLALLLILAAANAGAQEAQGEVAEARVIEEIVTIGTRRRERAAVDTAVPVDVFSAEEVSSVNSSDLIEVINAIVPSFAARRHPISDGASFIRPTHMRGLDTHHTLVLMNGRRRHRSALMQVGGFGAHGTDIGVIPSIAIESMEVLRDGAAAQYGSDAIAGVINFNLKQDDSGAELRARSGRYGEGDGDEFTLEGNIGFTLPNGGFLNLSGQYSDSAPTSRSQPYDLAIAGSGQTPAEATGNRLTLDGVTYYGPDALTYRYSPTGEILQAALGSDGVPDDIDSRYADNFAGVGGNRDFRSPAQIWGQPDRRQLLASANASLPLSDSLELHGFATWAAKDQSGGFFYRRAGVSQLLPVRLADGAIYDPRARLYPAGFTPQFSGDVTDYAITIGLSGSVWRDLGFDLSAGYGYDRIAYSIENTLNPSLGPDTPTRFRPGALANDELAVNADFVWPWDIGNLASPVNVAFGFEYRTEGYRIEAGEPRSYEVGPFGVPDPFNLEITQAEVDADPDDDLIEVECRIPGFEAIGSLCPAGDPVNNAVPIGSNGFPGYPPGFASRRNRGSYAAYVDLEADLTDRWLVEVAGRYEDFQDFGDVATWKVAARFRLSDSINLRGSAGSGFRAPTPGQISTTVVSTRIDANGIPRSEGVFPPDHPAAGLFGGAPLGPEHSHSFTLGLAARSTAGFGLTLDYYRVRLDDRTVMSSQFTVNRAQAARLIALGVPGANDISRVRFFVNDVATETSGFDLVATGGFDSRLGATSVQAAFNFNRTEFSDTGKFVNAETRHDIEEGSPAVRGSLTLRHGWRLADVLLRARYFGEYSNANTAALEQVQKFGSEVLLDLEAALTLGERYTLRIGAENVLDNYPDPGQFEVCCGRIYRSDSIMPWQGRLFYAQLGISFF